MQKFWSVCIIRTVVALLEWLGDLSLPFFIFTRSDIAIAGRKAIVANLSWVSRLQYQYQKSSFRTIPPARRTRTAYPGFTKYIADWKRVSARLRQAHKLFVAFGLETRRGAKGSSKKQSGPTACR